MCLVKVREEVDPVVPYRVSSPPRRGSRRVSRTVERHSVDEYRSPRHSERRSETRVVVPASPPPLKVPPPQPAPVFVNPPPRPMPVPAAPSIPAYTVRSRSPGAHYVHISPESSATSVDRSDIYVHEERREVRDHEPEYEHYRYVDPPREEPRYVRRDRSMSRGRHDDPRDSRDSYRDRVTRERISVHAGSGGRRASRDYYR